MPEAITQYAINSTLGTEDFEPLDKIIKGQKSLKVSNNLYQAVLEEPIEISGGDKQIEKKSLFKLNWNGSFKIKFVASVVSSSSSSSAAVYIYKNNIEQEVISLEREYDIEYFSKTLNFNKNDVFGIVIETGSRTTSTGISALDIYADIIDGSAITIL